MKYSKARSVLAYSFAFFAAAFVLAALFALEGRYPGLAKYNYCFAAAGVAVVLFLLILFLVYFVSTKKEAVRLVTTLSDSLDPLKKESVENFPLALAVTDSTGEIEWYNGLFRENIIAGRSSDIKYLGDLIGENAQKLIKENGGNAL